jgi:hypothetical protein
MILLALQQAEQEALERVINTKYKDRKAIKQLIQANRTILNLNKKIIRWEMKYQETCWSCNAKYWGEFDLCPKCLEEAQTAISMEGKD